MHDILTLEIGGAFKSPAFDVNFYVTNQPGFNYVSVKDGTYYTTGTLEPTVITWLMDTRDTSLDLGHGFIIERLTTYDFLPDHKKTVTTRVIYNSIHHRDER